MVFTKAILLGLLFSTPGCERSPFVHPCRGDTRSEKRNENVKVVATDVIALQLPRSLEEMPVGGDASRAWEYRSPEMTVSIETGPYVSSFEELRGHRDYCEESIRVNGAKMKIVSLDFGVENRNGQFFVGAHFPESKQTALPITVSISFRSRNERQAAFDIIDSIKLLDRIEQIR